ncbi:MAG: hypothetical protein K0S65_1335, partial [Labilithrix sp.]|nr:hypothetical protein [Labilithrix sp.]
MNRLGAISVLMLLAACSSSTTSDGVGDPGSPGGGGQSSGGQNGNGGPGTGNGNGTGGNGPTVPPPEGTRPGCKRGVAYGYHSEADMRALSKGVSWWYNWAFEPDNGVRNVFATIGLEYVPMVWGAKVD